MKLKQQEKNIKKQIKNSTKHIKRNKLLKTAFTLSKT